MPGAAPSGRDARAFRRTVSRLALFRGHAHQPLEREFLRAFAVLRFGRVGVAFGINVHVMQHIKLTGCAAAGFIVPPCMNNVIPASAASAIPAVTMRFMINPSCFTSILPQSQLLDDTGILFDIGLDDAGEFSGRRARRLDTLTVRTPAHIRLGDVDLQGHTLLAPGPAGFSG